MQGKIPKIYSWLGGRSMTVAWAVLIAGTVLALVGRLTVEWTGLALGIVAAVKTRAALGDKWSNDKESR